MVYAWGILGVTQDGQNDGRHGHRVVFSQLPLLSLDVYKSFLSCLALACPAKLPIAPPPLDMAVA